MKKRFLAILMAVTLGIGMVPTLPLAEESGEETPAMIATEEETDEKEEELPAVSEAAEAVETGENAAGMQENAEAEGISSHSDDSTNENTASQYAVPACEEDQKVQKAEEEAAAADQQVPAAAAEVAAEEQKAEENTAASDQQAPTAEEESAVKEQEAEENQQQSADPSLSDPSPVGEEIAPSGPAPTIRDATYDAATKALTVVFTTTDTKSRYIETYLLTNQELANAMGNFTIKGVFYRIWGISSLNSDQSNVFQAVDGTGVAKVVIDKETQYFGNNEEPKEGDKFFVAVQTEGDHAEGEWGNGSELNVPLEMLIKDGIGKLTGGGGEDECEHTNTMIVSDGETGHHEECADCHKALTDTFEHIFEKKKISAGSIGHYAKCQLCPYTTEIEAHTRQLVSDGDQGHYDQCSVCEARLTETKAHKRVYVIDNDTFHHEECSVCHWSFTAIERHNKVRNSSADGTTTWEECVCGWKGPEIKNLDKASVSEIAVQKFTGEPVKPAVTVTLGGVVQQEGVDYTVVYENNDKPGTGIARITGVEGKSIGSRTIEFEIPCGHPQTRYVSDRTLGHHQECVICNEKLTESEAHNFVDNVCKDCGARLDDLIADLETAVVKGVPEQAEYTGEPITFDISVLSGDEKLKAGDEYTLDYLDNIDIGIGKVTITSVEGRSKGSQTKTFEIVEKCDHNWQWTAGSKDTHWQQCTRCLKTTDPEAHVYDNVTVVKAATCTEDAVLKRACKCGRVDESDTAPHEGDPAEWFAHHSWEEGYQSNLIDHWKTCTVCGLSTEKEAHGKWTNITVQKDRTCVDNAVVYADCGICGAQHIRLLDEELRALDEAYIAVGHDYTGPIQYIVPRECKEEVEGTHAPTCTVCGKKDYSNASPHSWVLHTVSNGTCEDPDDPVIIEGTCECGATLFMQKMRHHDPVLDTSKDVQPTCTQPGKINGHRCRICGLFYDYTDVPAAGHKKDKLIERVAPTCETAGYEIFECSVCHETIKTILPTLSKNGHHNWVRTVTVEPTCYSLGTAFTRCSICQAEGESEVLPRTNHKLSVTKKKKGERLKFNKYGTDMNLTIYEATFTCTFPGCNYKRTEIYNVYTTVRRDKYEIVRGKNAEITELKNGVHIKGQFAKDEAVIFQQTVVQALNAEVDKDRAQYEKSEGSIILTFTDAFLSELEDGDYELLVLNGDEYWPMIVTVKDHKFEELRDVEKEEGPQLTDEEIEAIWEEADAAGNEIKDFFSLLQPWIESDNEEDPEKASPNADDEIVITKDDGDYVFDSLKNEDYTLQPEVDYTITEDKVTIHSDYLKSLEGEQKITFHYTGITENGIPEAEDPILTVTL